MTTLSLNSSNPGPASVSTSNGGGNRVYQTLSITGLLYESATDNITARAGGGQTLATPLTTETNRVATVASPADSVMLPVSSPGLTIFITNHGANPMQVFGAGTDTIDDVATATGVSQMANSEVLYTCHTAGQWYTEGLASGFVRGFSLQTMSAGNVAANVTGTQASGTALVSMLNTVSSAGVAYSVTLPPSSPGMQITVICTTATNTVAVFPNAGGTTTEAINALSANAGITMGALTSTTFNCTVAGQWFTTPRVPS